jgi:hypothetical protein
VETFNHALATTIVISMAPRMGVARIKVNNKSVVINESAIQHILAHLHHRLVVNVVHRLHDGFMIQLVESVKRLHTVDVMETVTTSPLNKIARNIVVLIVLQIIHLHIIL